MSDAAVLERSGRDARTDRPSAGAAPCGAATIARSRRSTPATSAGSPRYVFGMVKDYGRAEDITQEVFVSALRRMRQTERPIAFKPWIYEIAKNACIDAYRRGRRAEEVSFDADDRLSPVRLTAGSSRPARSPTPPSTPSRTSTTCAARSAACPRATTRSSSCASSRA